MLRIKDSINTNILKALCVLLLIILPWSILDTDKDSQAITVDDSSVGYYQTNTCEISLAEVFLENIGNKNVKYTFDNYSSISCFGKVNGLDKIDEYYKVGIGTNILVNLTIQIFAWLLIISFIPRSTSVEFNKKTISFISLLTLFYFHIYGESSFYELSSRNFDNTLSFKNYFLLSSILIFLIMFYLVVEVLQTRMTNVLVYFPFMFVLIGTFNAMNLNIFVFIFSFFGIQYLFEERLTKKVQYISLIYFSILLLIWINNISQNEYLFDVDKLRGFSNSSSSAYSIIFWSISIYLIFFGVKFSLKYFNYSENATQLFKNFLISGSLITVFGILGSFSSLLNFIIFFNLGLNKRGSLEFESISGNTWRGAASSAEALGEFYALVIFLAIYYFLQQRFEFTNLNLFLIVLNLYGFYRANNVAGYISLLLIICFVVVKMYRKKDFDKFLIFILVISPLFIFSLLKINNVSYEVASRSVILEGLRYSNLFENETDRNLNVDRFFVNEDDLETIFLYDNNQNKISSSLDFVIKNYNKDNNISNIPNPVAAISSISYTVNRSEKWGIFFSKYDPDLKLLMFGSGPLQLSNYFNSFNSDNIDGLILPHSSLLDIILFFGLPISLLILYLILKKIILYRNENNIFWYLLVLQFVNLLKSDSILYISSLILLLLIYLEIGRKTEVKDE